MSICKSLGLGVGGGAIVGFDEPIAKIKRWSTAVSQLLVSALV